LSNKITQSFEKNKFLKKKFRVESGRERNIRGIMVIIVIVVIVVILTL